MSYINILIDEIYYAGHSINGKLICYFRSEKNVRGIYVKVTGKEHTGWQERETRRVTRNGKTEDVVEYIQYTGDNEIFSQKIQLENGTRTMQGHHEYNFTIDLPYDLPSTYESTYGWIRYKVKACVDRPMSVDMENEKHFKLISPVNLSQLGNPMSPMHTGDEKTVCCFCCASGPVNVDMYLDKSGFILGEFMRIRITCTNLSNRSIEQFRIKLKQSIRAEVTSPSHHNKYLEELLGGGNHAGVGAHGEDNFEFLIELPKEFVIHNFRGSRLFNCHYELKLNCEFDGCSSDIDLELHPKIGHIQSLHETGMNSTPNMSTGHFSYGTIPNQNPYPVNPGFVVPGASPGFYPPPTGPAPPYPNPMPMPMPPMPGGSNYNGQTIFQGGPPSAPLANDLAQVHRNTKEKELLDDRPSAPFNADNPTAPPPSYDDIQKS